MQSRSFLETRFARRLLVLGVAAMVVFAALGAQLVRLAVVEHADHRSVAERRLDRVSFLPTHRGRIVDRHGRVLAEDRPAWDVALEYDFIGGAWAVRQARRAAREELGASRWSELSAAARGEAIERHLPIAEARGEWVVRNVCALCDIDRSEFEARLDGIRRRVALRAATVWDRQRELERSRHVDGDERFVPRPIREQMLSHVVAAAVPDVVAFELSRLADLEPGILDVRDSTRRVTPLMTLDVDLDRSTLPRALRTTRPIRLRLDGVADHIVGDLRDSVWPSDLRRRPFVDEASGELLDLGGYRPGLDHVGARGVEAAQEGLLRGSRGMVRTRLDSGETVRVEPEPGRDVQLTIDIELQAMVQGILDPRFGLMRTHAWQSPTDGEESAAPPRARDLLGAAVVIEVATGEILAAVSRPTIAEGLRLDERSRIEQLPFVNRPFEAPYPPGSIFKPLIFLGAVEAKALAADARIACRGHYLPENPQMLRCWIYRERTGFATHESRVGGPLDITEAIARSCNIYFYTAAARLGPARLVPWLRKLGIGAPLDTGLLVPSSDDGRAPTGEHGGFLPDPAKLGSTEAALIGIGQGPVAWTPVMAANAFATIARGGLRRDATIVRGHGERRAAREAKADLAIAPAALRPALRGLRDVVSAEHGTATSIRYEDGSREPIIDQPGLVVWGKTGTVQTGSDPDHAWFVGLVGTREGAGASGGGHDGAPLYAIAVIVEHGRSGGRTAGPIFNQIVHALRRLGYLPAAEAAGPPARGPA
ncbi:MAG TPA: penicillin-binding transpeptidase domain-containing protein [Phycisphaerales bacterium]|nr:penicillin-binding transpeptidase domain-containing protein [Phycisphaerales bacterium]HMP37834.1 penicillin-binding transpeptidase domain-containing protein [Phycisphaerales bacterium]